MSSPGEWNAAIQAGMSARGKGAKEHGRALVKGRNVDAGKGRAGVLLLGYGAGLVFVGVLELSARSILRVWVDSHVRLNQGALPYDGALLLVSGSLMIALGIVMLAFSFQNPRRAAVEELRGSMVLLAAGNLGYIAAAVSQAAMHVARLAIPSGEIFHPRSLTGTATAAVLLGLGLLAYSLRSSSGRRRV